MKTASFFTYKGPGRVSIARFAPRDTPAGFRVYKPLAPGPWFNKVTKGEYEQRYAAQLAELNPAVVAAQLHELAGDAEPVLLCWERPPFTKANWCHRRIVARWFQEHLGLQLLEHIDRARLEAEVAKHVKTDDGPLFSPGEVRETEQSDAELIALLPPKVAEGLGLK